MIRSRSSKRREPRGPKNRPSNCTKIGAKSSKSAEKSSSKAAKAAAPKESSRKTDEKASPAAPKGGNGKGKTALSVAGGFSNPIIAEAFRRAVKKYPIAFRRLTD